LTRRVGFRRTIILNLFQDLSSLVIDITLKNH
jgi:hypothetical protein